ncbi:DNA helicase RecG [bacterium (Candidatus Gribaldobacteria) CG07_land_8_20_14_0_80_33_18]|uniref:ATP-dependent DNA helicase RecG n=1 Tax=bacterium (Candidatus Gribaldobacteria) CG07_land_8_20_14_0_80_33_18 TaxID=2014272 RepID=A0A2M6Z4E5_9BACT|nr:MAG: DNA helicase RecG [bacterium (Candidatus Gribaldobacteria) CG10_big_fil_rev_8_21_14_0_10_33_41]PIU47271.1 MAG: DNA helicase RecG [bacterium (Candidatus Gribaldobacteria) CG07_land_8_20_14_0_80_33_18]PJA00980.1 MAG: DNA helicase RecG [bacterium (Candidatus Gribaldobacteria) CG_4_10_14_0_2_um_filter_33_15]PJB08734.1 MAG: DNA helicase RecG [bacterium (Candidatus Gribaldobacteria) CG_4_9_14_3_um_filter_33_9]
MDINTSIEQIERVGPIYLKRLKKLGINTISDLIFHFPSHYEDFSNIIPILQVKLNETSCLQGEILEIKNTRTWKKKMFLTQAIVQDKSGAIKIIWFNQPYLTKILKSGDKVCLAGKIVLGKSGLYLSNPIYEKLPPSSDIKYFRTDFIHTGRIVPVYPETEGLSSRWLRMILKPILERLRYKIPETLPEKIRKENELLGISEAIWQVHFPNSKKLAEKAKERFAFEELFLIELSVLKERLKLKKEKAIPISFNLELTQKFVNSLPFKLTNAQKKCAWQILKDLEKSRPMSRLLEGDVGSGKTVVAVITALNVVKANGQVVFMAPTEILAKQHFNEVRKLLSPFKIKIALLTSKEDKITSLKLKGEILEISQNKLLEKTRKGEIDILIGTHSLIQDKVKFFKLALVIIDEQHRFGVGQRAKLVARGTDAERKIPHLLSMTATPIPRTLALTIYGDLDISILDEMPKGRKKIETKIVSPEKRKETYEFIRKEVKNGKGVFVICPRIEPAKNNNGGEDVLGWAEVKAVKEEYEKLKKEVFPDLKIGMLYGKMKAKEKEKIMEQFKKGKLDILVSTSVVEVGIDVPRATIMMIEGAERFGLAQLYQLKGRVGRSLFQSYCFLFTDLKSRKIQRRLRALIDSEDSFKLAQKDLGIRGPGTLEGIKQWGVPDLAMENLKNISLVEKVRETAKELLMESPELLKYPLLLEKLKTFQRKIHFE